MASTEFATGGDHSVVRWSNELTEETFDRMYCKRFMGTDDNAIIRYHRDLVTGAGDTIHVPLLVQDRTPPRTGDQELAGFETAMTFYDDTVAIEQGRKGIESRGMSQQRVSFDLDKAARNVLSRYWAGVFDSLMMAYAAGYTGDVASNAECCLNYVGSGGWASNAFQTPDAAHAYDPSATSTLAHWNFAKEKAKVANPRVEPTLIDGKPYYVAMLHPRSMRTLRNHMSASAINVTEIFQNAGPRASSNPILSGSEFVYNGMIFYESEFIPCASGPLVYNLLLGAAALHFAVGNAWGRHISEPAMFKKTQELRDYENIRGIGSTLIFGMKGARWNSANYGRITVIADDAAA